ncbi:lysozyme inhibitor LprI family protein [Shewanella sp.]|uniref:lysozyme inhibitor LprI family protein n=1 Tax=Shewanella sp. TaxID=50422 RepID=UPI00258D99C2|nr:lysozyme inhibitor LprI family protein [Shewanella sp.]MCJ8301390.1 lysozyme inhibitor LprI family protein [Shewanella sp.]
MFQLRKIIFILIITPFFCSADDLVKTAIQHDEQLNIAYKNAIPPLNKNQIKKLKKAQLLWIRYRDAICEFESDLPNKGHWIKNNIANSKSLECISRLSVARTKELNDYSKLTGSYKKNTSQNQIILDRSILNNENALGGWMSYGLALRVWPVELGQDGQPNLYKREIFARSKTAQIWQELRDNKAVNPNKDLDELVYIYESGYMEEYVWAYIRKSSRIQNSLKLDKFKQWMFTNLPAHKAIINTGVKVPIP